MEATCLWSEDEDGNWASACQNLHVFIEGGPKENGYEWCCYCGLKLAPPHAYVDEVIQEEEADETGK